MGDHIPDDHWFNQSIKSEQKTIVCTMDTTEFKNKKTNIVELNSILFPDKNEFVYIKQLIGEQSQGTVWSAEYKNKTLFLGESPIKYAFKVEVLSKRKVDHFIKECKVSQFASKKGFGPKIFKSWLIKPSQTSPPFKYIGCILMEQLADTVDDILQRQEGRLTEAQQNEFIKCIEITARNGICPADAHSGNMMFGFDNKVYMIDFGKLVYVSKKIPNVNMTQIISHFLFFQDPYHDGGYLGIRESCLSKSRWKVLSNIQDGKINCDDDEIHFSRIEYKKHPILLNYFDKLQDIDFNNPAGVKHLIEKLCYSYS
tara:strand:- start:1046 stop:1984 length:939 start_codon:yes stop_codon:yes gene_type:complete